MSSPAPIDDLAADIVAFLDAVEIERATLVGHSASGFIARRVAETHPDHVARLVLINCAVTLHASVPHVPLPGPVLERLVAQSLKAPARVWKSALEGSRPPARRGDSVSATVLHMSEVRELQEERHGL